MADRANSLLADLKRLKVETGSLACMGCGREHNCGVHGCAILRESADVLQEYVDRCKRYAEEIMALRERVKQGMAGDKYYEIWALLAYCKRQDISAEIEPLFDGWKLVFPNGDDFVQHEYSYMGNTGALEPAIGCEDDFSPVTLEAAKVLVLKYRKRLVVPRVELPEAKEGEK